MNRNPPKDVIRQLRSEVGFGCPVPGCANPLLEWHHFDPPWRVTKHHNPEGMVALCREHHFMADNGAYTNAQLAAFKKAKANSALIKGKFNWRRNKLLAIVGGNFFYEIPRILSIDGHDVVSISRDNDDERCLLLSVKMLSLSRDVRIVLVDNVWENIGSPIDLESPPSGKKLSITYENGDHLSVEFSEFIDAYSFANRYRGDITDRLEFPLTVVEVNCNIGGTNISITPSGTSVETTNVIGGFSAYCANGFRFNLGKKWRQNSCLGSGLN